MSTSISAVLPSFLRPKKIAELVRLGKENDGGYLVDKRSICETDFMLGFGIKDDWSFERDFKDCVDVPIVAFDATVGLKVFFMKLIRSIPRVDKPGKFVHWARVLIDYHDFFRASNTHIKKFVDLDTGPNHVSVKTISKSVIPLHAKNVFLKIDIEGSEYQILDDLVMMSDRICGLVIEFHDVDLHMERIESFVRSFPLRVCHVHCNNFAPTNDRSTPVVIEVTFTKFEGEDGFVENLPVPLDMPNDSTAEDYSIEFS